MKIKHLALTLLAVFFAAFAYAQNDVTKFLGIPVDGPKSEMVRALKAKGFQQVNDGNTEYFTGRFNGVDVNVYIVLESGKVARIVVHDKNPISETDIKIRFNTLCQQFSDNGKYIALEDYSIPGDERISYEMLVHNKRYEALFYQAPEGEAKERIAASIIQELSEKYDSDKIEHAINSPSDDTDLAILADFMSSIKKAINHKPVWFMISEHYGKYYISMFYDNELNRAHGQDL